MRYVIAEYTKYRQELAYRFYISDSLYYQAENQRLVKRYADIIEPQQIETRTSDEIAQDIITKFKLKVK